MRIKKDRVERTFKYRRIRKELEEKIEKKMNDLGYSNYGIGMCHIYWNIKKNILEEEYGINWRSPSELNPHIIFD